MKGVSYEKDYPQNDLYGYAFRSLSATVHICFRYCQRNNPDVTPADQVIEEAETMQRASLYFPEIYDGGGIPLYLLHTITANGLNTKLLLNSAKTITKGKLPSDAKKLYITGLLNHNGFSTGTKNVSRTGLCYQDSDSNYYIGAYYMQMPDATNFTEILCSVSSLNRNVTYYPYIKNLEPDYGSVSGSVGFYYSTT